MITALLRMFLFVAVMCLVLGYAYVDSVRSAKHNSQRKMRTKEPCFATEPTAQTEEPITPHFEMHTLRPHVYGSKVWMDGFEKCARAFDMAQATQLRPLNRSQRRVQYGKMLNASSRCMRYLNYVRQWMQNDLNLETEFGAFMLACERHFNDCILRAYDNCYTSEDEVFPTESVQLLSDPGPLPADFLVT
jgi:hypothetical protein